MGLVTWMIEHHPQARMNRVVYDMQQSRGGVAGFKSFGHESKGFLSDAATVGLAIYTRGASLTTQTTHLNAVLGRGIFYDPGNIDVTSYGVVGYNLQLLREQSSGRAVADTSIGGSKREDARVTSKSSRGAKSPQTLKPFWSNGKPKCRKGYRYDFKRKMCVKKS